MSSREASGFSSVWSINLAISDSVCGMLFRRKAEDADVFQVAIAFCVIQAVAHHKFVGDFKTDIVRLHIFNPARRFIQKRSHPQSFRFSLLQNAQEVAQRQAGIQYIFDHHDVKTLDAAVEVFQNAHLARRLLSFAIAGYSDEIDRSIEAQLADKVGEKNARALQHSDEVDALSLEILGNLMCDLANPFLNRRAAD